MVSVSHGHSIHTRGTSCNLCISNKISSGKNIAQSLLWSFSLPWLITFWEVPLQPGGKNSQIGFISTYIRSQVLHFLPLLPNNYKWVKKKKKKLHKGPWYDTNCRMSNELTLPEMESPLLQSSSRSEGAPSFLLHLRKFAVMMILVDTQPKCDVTLDPSGSDLFFFCLFFQPVLFIFAVTGKKPLNAPL